MFQNFCKVRFWVLITMTANTATVWGCDIYSTGYEVSRTGPGIYSIGRGIYSTGRGLSITGHHKSSTGLPAYLEGRSYPQLSSLSTFLTLHIPLIPNWRCIQTTPPFSLNPGEPKPSPDDSPTPWPFYTDTSPNGNFVWTSTKQWLYYLLNVVLPPRLHSSFNTLSSLGVHIPDTLASSSTPNSCSRNTYTLLNTRPPAYFSNSSPSSPVPQSYPVTKNSPSTNYWSAPYLPTPPPFGAIHLHLTIVIFKFFNPNVLESLVIILDVPTFHTYTPLLTSNPFMSLQVFTVWRINFSTTVLLTLTLLFAK
jgi:hypothetical protein